MAISRYKRFASTLNLNYFIQQSIVLLLIVGLVLEAQPTLGQGISVAPSRIFFSADKGGSQTKTIKVTNSGNQAMVLLASLRDWIRDSVGEKVYSLAGTNSNSNASWIRFQPTQTTIQPNESVDISVVITVPNQAAKVTNSMLFLTQINDTKPISGVDANGRKMAINFKLEVGIQIYNTVPGEESKNLEFISFEDRGMVNDSTKSLVLGIQNNGNIPTDAHLRLELTNISSGATIKLTPKPISMLPNTFQKIALGISPKQNKGKYLATAILEYGEDVDLKVAKKEIVYD